MVRMKVVMAALFALSLAIGLATAPVQAQGPLVNVVIGDISACNVTILSNNTVEWNVAVNYAVNICGNQVVVESIAADILQSGKFYCQNDQNTQFVEITGNPVP